MSGKPPMPSPAADRDPIRENPADDSFDVLLEEAYGPRLEQASPDGGEAASFLEVIRERTRSTSHRARRTAERETVPLTDQGVLALEWQADSAQRYRMLEEISRGGIGVVFRVRDTNLDRDVAIKVLRGGYRASETMVQRFEEEAQIEGRLQHPGIVPVHDAGHLADRRPFFTMKLVEGDTLASLLRQRRTPQEDRRRFLSIFEKLLETVAYAHSRDVIHRDLKPSNVMVGAFGEVQVMDWGLSKVLGAETAEAGPGGTEPAAELAAPATTAEPRSETGSVMGTPAYMPPEQARGEVEKLDAHSDVFSLGAILCEILTGEPPFTGSSPREIRARAAEADLRPALERLAASHADRELVELATRCLAADPLARPRDAREVAGAFAGYLASLEERARAAEIAAARAEVKAAEERRARRLTLALAATILLALLAAGAAYLWLDAARRARVAENTRAVNGALAEAASLRGQARGAGVGDLSPWVRAVEAARRAVLTARPGEVDADVEIRAAALLAEVEDEQQAARAAAAQAAADRATVEQLEDIRLRAADLWDTASDYEAQTDAAYAAAFRDHGIDVDALSPDEAARRIAASTVSMPLVAALDDWVGVRRRQAERGKGKPDWARLHAIAQAADPDPVRRRARDAWRADDLTTLRALAGEADVASWPVATLVVLGGALGGAGDLEQAVSLLAEARRHHPRDFWIHHNLGVLLDRLKPPRLQEAARCLEVAVAIRPTSVSTRTSLAVVLLRMGELEAAERACRDALRIAPGYAGALHTLGLVQQRTGRLAEARASLEEAIRRRPDSLASHAALADILRAAGAPADGLTRINAAIEGAPGQAGFHYMRGRILQDLGKHDEAAAAFHRAIELDPRHADAHVQLGLSLKRLGKAGEAIAEYEAALRIDPGHAIAHLNLGVALVERGDRAGAAAAFRRAVESDPRLVAAHNSLGELLARQGDLDGAAASYRRALAVEPEDVTALVGLGRAVSRQGHPRESLRWFDEALRVQPGCYAALDALAVVWLEQLGDRAKGLAYAREAARVAPQSSRARANLGAALAQDNQLEAAIAELQAAVEIDPRNVAARVHLGHCQWRQGDLPGAIGTFRAALETRPDFAAAQSGLGMALREAGDRAGALQAFEAARKLDPADAEARVSLAGVLLQEGQIERAIALCREAIAIERDSVQAWYDLGLALSLAGGRRSEVVDAFAEVVRLRPEVPQGRAAYGSALAQTGQARRGLQELEEALRLAPASEDVQRRLAEVRPLAELEEKLAAILDGKEAIAGSPAYLSLAKLCLWKDLPAASARFWKAAFEANDRLAEDSDNRYNAACAAALAGCGRGSDAASLDADDRARWRAQAIAWLRLTIAAMRQRLESAKDSDGRALRDSLAHWKRDPDLEGLRDTRFTALLPGSEAKACADLWRDVDQLLEVRRAQ